MLQETVDALQNKTPEQIVDYIAQMPIEDVKAFLRERLADSPVLARRLERDILSAERNPIGPFGDESLRAAAYVAAKRELGLL